MKKAGIQHRRPSRGMTLVEVLIAMVLLTVGLIGLLSTLTFAMAATHSSSQDLIAKQLASEAMENIFTARDSAQLVWLQIQNQGAGTAPDGIFATGLQPINQVPTAGNNAGLINTAEYIASPAKVLTTAGPDGILGTGDDVTVPLVNFQRSITIVSVPGSSDQLRSITINVQYSAPPLNVQRNYTLQGYISQFR
jgi:type IV pilus modification protein PilV